MTTSEPSPTSGRDGQAAAEPPGGAGERDREPEHERQDAAADHERARVGEHDLPGRRGLHAEEPVADPPGVDDPVAPEARAGARQDDERRRADHGGRGDHERLAPQRAAQPRAECLVTVLPPVAELRDEHGDHEHGEHRREVQAAERARQDGRKGAHLAQQRGRLCGADGRVDGPQEQREREVLGQQVRADRQPRGRDRKGDRQHTERRMRDRAPGEERGRRHRAREQHDVDDMGRP